MPPGERVKLDPELVMEIKADLEGCD